MKPTHDQYLAFQKIYDHFNKTLFRSELPQVMLTFSRECKRAYGFFSPKRWLKDGSAVHEISLNPDHFSVRKAKDILGTLVHEMVHLWQECYGNPSRKGYHNKQWAEKMKQIGLYPSSTGSKGGKETGQSCSHYIIDNGCYEKAFVTIDKADLIPLTTIQYLESEKKKKRNDKLKYSCISCDSAVWGKDGLNIVCADCDEKMTVE